MPLLAIALTRPVLFERRALWGEGQAAHSRIELRRLSKRDSRHLVAEILQKVDKVPPDLQDLIVRGAEGNPFYVEELIRMLIEDGVIEKGVDQWQVEMSRLPEVRIPPTLTGVLQARLDRLPQYERETLQQASVVGRIFWDGAVERISGSAGAAVGESETGAALRSARGKELIFQREKPAFEETREYIFKHAILRDVTYESVLRRLRRVYHGQVAAWLIEQSGERVGEYAGLIGEHYERAEERARAAEWYGRAGRQAQETYALETALDYYQKALAVEERWEWRKGEVEVLHVLGRRDEEQAALRTLEAAPEAPVFETAYLWGQYYEAIGESPEAQAAVERALEANRKRDDLVGEVRCLDRLGFITWRQGQYDEAKARYHQALVLLHDKDTFSDEESQALAQVLNGLGTVHRAQGQFDEAKKCYNQALALNRMIANRIGEARTISNMGLTAYYCQHFDEALMHHQQALKIRQAIGDRAGEGASLGNVAAVAYGAGDYGQAEKYYSAALAIHRVTGNRWDEVNIWMGLGAIYQELGDLAAARDSLEQGRQLSWQIGDEAGLAYILGSLGLVVREQGDLETAEELLVDGLALAQAQADKYLESLFLTHLGIVSLRAGKTGQAMERARAALTMCRELDLRSRTPDDLATLAAAHLAAGEANQAQEYAQQAMTILDTCGGEGPESPQRDYLICYQVLFDCGQKGAARVALQSAHNLVKARADKITDLALRQSFLERVKVNRQIAQEYERVMRET